MKETKMEGYCYRCACDREFKIENQENICQTCGYEFSAGKIWFLKHGKGKKSFKSSSKKNMMKKIVDDVFSDNPLLLTQKSKKIFDTVKVRFSNEAIKKYKRKLIQIEKEAIKSKNPLKYIREYIMVAATESLFHQELLKKDEELITKLGEKDEAYTYENIYNNYVIAETDVVCLRCYSQMVFNDMTQRDWFFAYCEAMNEYQAAMANAILLSNDLYDGDPKMLLTFLKIFEETAPKLKENLLKVMPGTIFPEIKNENSESAE